MSISGWCQTHGRSDGFHEVCEQRIAAGLIASCDCANHRQIDAESPILQGDSTDRRLRPVPAKES